MPKTADLHVHTHISDSTFSPEKVVLYAKEKGIDAIAITDHDSCEGIKPATLSAIDLAVEIIPGVELTAELNEEEIHILGYFIDWKNHLFLKKLSEICILRNERAREILKKLENHRVYISENELFELSGPGCVGRLHIATLLVKKGVVSSIEDAFRKYIGNNACCYVGKFKLSPKEAVDMIRAVGGVAVLAHPKIINIKKMSTEDIVKSLVRDGVEGIEVYHSGQSVDEEKELKGLSERYNLLITGGSDCHGFGKREVLIGSVKIPYELVERMKDYQRTRL